jgi:hypothetical protein
MLVVFLIWVRGVRRRTATWLADVLPSSPEPLTPEQRSRFRLFLTATKDRGWSRG